MQIRRANRTQRYGIKDNSNLSASIDATRATSQMYDEMTNSFLKLADVATTSAINSEIRSATEEGEAKGAEAVRRTEEGGFKGYEKDMEIFKWDVASNNASKTTFEAGVSSRASSAMQNLSKEVNGNKQTYETVAKEMMGNAVKGVDDEQQRRYISNAYAKSYNQNMGTVSTKYIQVEGKLAKDGWTAGRDSFKDDYATKLQVIEHDKKQFKHAMGTPDVARQDAYIKKIKSDEASLIEFAKARASKAGGALQLGVISTEEIERDVKADIVSAMSTSAVQSYRTAETQEERNRIIGYINGTPDTVMSPRNKATLLKSLDDEELQEQKMWKSDKARSDKEYAIDKKISMDTINMDMLDDSKDEATLVNLKDALNVGYITEKEYQDYRNRVINGSPVTRDIWSNYTELANNVEVFTASDIAGMAGLTDATKKKFIGDRLAWEEAGQEWMTLPAYRGGKDIIRDAYGFPEKGIMPEFFTKAERDKYTEMNSIQHEYRDRVQASVSKGEHYNGMAIAEEIMARQKTDVRSSMYGKYADNKILRKKDLIHAKTVTGGTLKNIMSRQYERFPDTKFSSDIEGAMQDEPPEEPITETRSDVKNNAKKTKLSEDQIQRLKDEPL